MVCLTIFTNESYPIEYAKTQKDLGVAYYNLAEVRDKEENLNLALKASKEALNIYSREKYPVENADVQNILSQIYLGLTKVRDKEKNINMAINASARPDL